MYYVCKKIEQNTCVLWQEFEQSTPLLDALAISTDDAYKIAFAIISLQILGFVGGLIGRILLNPTE